MALRVGVVIDPWDYPYNGTVVSTRRFVTALSERVEFRLLATPHPEMAQDPRIFPFPKLSIPGVNGIIEGMRVPLANPWSSTDVKESLQGLDVVHMQFPFFLGREVCRKAKALDIPLICSFHVQPENLLRNLGMSSALISKWLYKLFIWAMYRHADLVLTPSQFAADQLRLHGLQRPIEVLSNGVPAEFFAVEKQPADSEKIQVLSVGRMASEKHHDQILRAVAKSRHKEAIQLRLIGAGPLQEELQDLAQALGIDALIGPTDNETLMASYRTADLFVHAGEIELEGMSVLEAMATGNAVLISDSVDSAATEFVERPEELFTAGDVSDLTRKLDYWLDHTEQRVAQGVENRTRARQRDHEHSVRQLYDTYQRFGQSDCRH